MKIQRTLLFTIFCSVLATCSIVGQNLPIIKPNLLHPNDYTEQEQLVWEQTFETYQALTDGKVSYAELDSIDTLHMDSLDQGYGVSTLGIGCSWYCGGGPSKINSSEYLSKNGNITYGPENVHDFNLLTAWVPKKAIGAELEFYFDPRSPRITSIIIYNGYIKNDEVWTNNSRVAKLLFKVDNQPIAILELEDVTNGQEFKFDSIKANDPSRDFKLSVEVLEIYRGQKYDDVVISEINFDGLDVH